MADGVNLLTGHQTTNHISAADEGFVNSAFFGGENSIIISADDAETLITINTTTGTVTVGACTALFTGRKVAVAGASASYTKPASGSVYRRVSAGLLYTRDTDTDVEDVSFVAYTSASDVQPASDAEDDETGAPTTTEITSASTTAYFELVNAVVSATAVSKQENTFATVDPYGDTVAELTEFEAATANFITDLSSRMNAVESAQTAETTARQNADTSLGNRVTSLETNSAVVRKLTKSGNVYNTTMPLVLVIVQNSSGVASFVACRHTSMTEGVVDVVSYAIAGGNTIGVAFPTGGTYVQFYVPSGTTANILGVYEIKAV